MDGDELGAIRKSRFDLDVVDHFGDALHDIVPFEQGGSGAHQFGDRSSVPSAFENLRSDEGHGFGMVQLQAAIPAPACQIRRNDDQKLLLLSWA